MSGNAPRPKSFRAAHITSVRQLNGAARKDFSRGAFPDITKARSYAITILRVRPGHEHQYTEHGKECGAAAPRATPADCAYVS